MVVEGDVGQDPAGFRSDDQDLLIGIVQFLVPLYRETDGYGELPFTALEQPGHAAWVLFLHLVPYLF